MYIRVCSYFEFLISYILDRYMIFRVCNFLYLGPFYDFYRVNKGKLRSIQETLPSLESDVQDRYLTT